MITEANRLELRASNIVRKDKGKVKKRRRHLDKNKEDELYSQNAKHTLKFTPENLESSETNATSSARGVSQENEIDEKSQSFTTEMKSSKHEVKADHITSRNDETDVNHIVTESDDECETAVAHTCKKNKARNHLIDDERTFV